MITRTHRTRIAICTLLSAIVILAPAAPAMAVEERTDRLVQVRLCDPTACYVAWSVVDSDHDGVSDADERMAGTDPYKAPSRPVLAPLYELAQARRLPSFEAGLGSFVVFPPEIAAARTKFAKDPLGAFPLHTRADGLSRMGISASQLKSVGIDPDRDGFAIGLDHKGSAGWAPGPRVAGIDARLISAGADSTTTHGGVKSFTTTSDGGSTTTIRGFNDGARETTVTDHATGDKTITRTEPDGSPGLTSQTKDSMDGDVQVHQDKTVEVDENGNVSAVVLTTEHYYPDGSVSTLTEATFFARDENGEVTSQLKVEVVEYSSADGSYHTAAGTTSECDAAGKSCTEVATQTDPPVEKKKYIDPDNDTGALSIDTFKHVLVMRGATVTIVAGWTAPVLDDGPRNPGDPGVIALVDPELGMVQLQLQPDLVGSARPEVNPDLPNPMAAASAGSGGGTCQKLCGG